MAKIDNIDKQRQADRRTALLALNADERRTDSDCLTDEELASLVDRKCTAEEQKQYLSHLAACEGCYSRWVELAECIDAETTAKKRKKVHTLMQPKQLAWAGSLLAAAASVVLFLNITGELPPPVVPQRMQTEQSISPSLPLEKSRKAEHKGDILAPEIELPAATPPPVTLEATSDSAHFSTSQAPPQPLPAQKAIRAKQSMAADELHEERAMIRAESASLQVSAWLENIQQGCQRGEANRQFWQKTYLEGEKIVRHTKLKRETLVTNLLPLIKQLQQSSEAGPPLCEQILERLDAAENH